MRPTLIIGLLIAGCTAPYDGKTTLLSRRGHDDYEKATFSFEHGVRDDPDGMVTRNDWDLQFGNGQDVFSVTMVTDDRSRIIDLGPMKWADLKADDLPGLPAHPVPTREKAVDAVMGHMYLVHTADSESDLYAVFRVEELLPGDRVGITWRRIRDDRDA